MLSAKQTKAVALLFDGNTQREIATILKVHENTVGNWRKLDEFKQAMQKMSDDYLAEKRAFLLKNQMKLATGAKSEMVKFSATKDLLDRAEIVNERFSKSEDTGTEFYINWGELEDEQD